MNALGSKLASIEERINNIEFFKPKPIGDALELLPTVKKIISENRNYLEYNPIIRELKEDNSLWYRLNLHSILVSQVKKEAYYQGNYNIIRKTVGRISNTVDEKVRKILHMYECEVGSIYTNSVWDELKKGMIGKTKRDLHNYVWFEAMKDEFEYDDVLEPFIESVEVNPFKALFELYELGLKPENPNSYYSLVLPFGKKISLAESDNKIVVGFPLEREQVYSNIAVGQFHKPPQPIGLIYLCIDNPVRDNRPKVYPKIKDMRHDYAVLKKPDIMERFTIGTYIDYSETIDFVRYWSEERYYWPNYETSRINLRPLFTKSS